MIGNILITGATGFVGLNLAVKLLKEFNNDLYLIVRGNKKLNAEERMLSLFAKYLGENYEEYRSRIFVVNGDVTKVNLGLDDQLYNELSQKIHYIFHSAASINFKLSLEESMKINVQGTKNMLEFSRQCLKNGQFKKFNHISTAYVAGNTKELFYENQLDINQEFENSYEITKFETEKIVNQYIDEGFPITIFRPSVIAGNFITGEITESNLIFGFIKQISSSRYKEFICNKDSSLNIIPIDYFVDGMLTITNQDSSLGKVYHLVNRHNSKIMELVQFCCKTTKVKLPEFIPLADRKKASLRTQILLEVFLPYIEKSHKFDDSVARCYLNSKEISCPVVDDMYMKRMIEYCIENNMISLKGECYEG